MELERNFFSTTIPSRNDRTPRRAGPQPVKKARDAVSWRLTTKARRRVGSRRATWLRGGKDFSHRPDEGIWTSASRSGPVTSEIRIQEGSFPCSGALVMEGAGDGQEPHGQQRCRAGLGDGRESGVVAGAEGAFVAGALGELCRGQGESVGRRRRAEGVRSTARAPASATWLRAATGPRRESRVARSGAPRRAARRGRRSATLRCPAPGSGATRHCHRR